MVWDSELPHPVLSHPFSPVNVSFSLSFLNCAGLLQGSYGNKGKGHLCARVHAHARVCVCVSHTCRAVGVGLQLNKLCQNRAWGCPVSAPLAATAVTGAFSLPPGSILWFREGKEPEWDAGALGRVAWKSQKNANRPTTLTSTEAKTSSASKVSTVLLRRKSPRTGQENDKSKWREVR